jgi:hypothetical protein
MTGQKRCMLLKELFFTLNVAGTTDMAKGVLPLERVKP